MADRGVPATGSVLSTLVGVTLRRLLRGRALWVILLIALLPVLLAGALNGKSEVRDMIAALELVVMVLLPCVFVASAIGEEIEDRTTTYLWSRPLARWTLVVGKLLALAPISAVLVTGSWLLAMQAGSAPVSLQPAIAFAAGTCAVSVVAAGIALLVPKHGMAVSIAYLVIIDLVVGGIPASLQAISITRQVRLLAGIESAPSLVTPAITTVVIAAVWLAIGLWRLRRLES
jgi:ABC-type transport system involved in multi-copper enzyme maturation permease subunit